MDYVGNDLQRFSNNGKSFNWSYSPYIIFSTLSYLLTSKISKTTQTTMQCDIIVSNGWLVLWWVWQKLKKTSAKENFFAISCFITVWKQNFSVNKEFIKSSLFSDC